MRRSKYYIFMLQKVSKNWDVVRKKSGKVRNFHCWWPIRTLSVPIDGLALFDAQTSAGILMIKFEACIFCWTDIEGISFMTILFWACSKHIWICLMQLLVPIFNSGEKCNKILYNCFFIKHDFVSTIEIFIHPMPVAALLFQLFWLFMISVTSSPIGWVPTQNDPLWLGI